MILRAGLHSKRKPGSLVKLKHHPSRASLLSGAGLKFENIHTNPEDCSFAVAECIPTGYFELCIAVISIGIPVR